MALCNTVHISLAIYTTIHRYLDFTHEIDHFKTLSKQNETGCAYFDPKILKNMFSNRFSKSWCWYLSQFLRRLEFKELLDIAPIFVARQMSEYFTVRFEGDLLTGRQRKNAQAQCTQSTMFPDMHLIFLKTPLNKQIWSLKIYAYKS